LFSWRARSICGSAANTPKRGPGVNPKERSVG
jgi:hypothetical protein